MVKTFHNLLRASPAALLAVIAPIAFGAVGSGEPQVVGAQLRPSRALEESADVQVRFVQEDGPAAGHVRVELTPDARQLSAFEARSAAQQAFLETLNEPGLGDALTRITVVVRLGPVAGDGATVSEERFFFINKGGRDWSVSGQD